MTLCTDCRVALVGGEDISQRFAQGDEVTVVDEPAVELGRQRA